MWHRMVLPSGRIDEVVRSPTTFFHSTHVRGLRHLHRLSNWARCSESNDGKSWQHRTSTSHLDSTRLRITMLMQSTRLLSKVHPTHSVCRIHFHVRRTSPFLIMFFGPYNSHFPVALSPDNSSSRPDNSSVHFRNERWHFGCALALSTFPVSICGKPNIPCRSELSNQSLHVHAPLPHRKLNNFFIIIPALAMCHSRDAGKLMKMMWTWLTSPY